MFIAMLRILYVPYVLCCAVCGLVNWHISVQTYRSDGLPNNAHTHTHKLMHGFPVRIKSARFTLVNLNMFIDDGRSGQPLDALQRAPGENPKTKLTLAE